MDFTTALETAQRTRIRQKATLVQTLDEIAYFETMPNALPLVLKLRIKRDRQEANLRATNTMIEILEANHKKASKLTARA